MWFGNEDAAAQIVDSIIAERPAVFIAGDFVYHPMDEDERADVEREDAADFMPEINRAVALVRPLTAAKIPVYAVFGSHDYGMSRADTPRNERLANALRAALALAGVSVLENQAVALAPPVAESAPRNSNTANTANTVNDSNADFYVVGIDSRYAGKARPEAAVTRVPVNAARRREARTKVVRRIASQYRSARRTHARQANPCAVHAKLVLDGERRQRSVLRERLDRKLRTSQQSFVRQSRHRFHQLSNQNQLPSRTHFFHADAPLKCRRLRVRFFEFSATR